MINTFIPPGKYFISHSYRDAEVRDKMIKQFPKGVDAFIFPPIEVSPEAFVSNTLMEAIRDCDGLIFLKGGYSEKSFWVSFEREYALRRKKPVFIVEWDIVTQEIRITHYQKKPIELHYSFVFALEDFELENKKLSAVFDHLDIRFFNAPIKPMPFFNQMYPVNTVRTATIEALKQKGFLIVFWSYRANKTTNYERERLDEEIGFGIQEAGTKNILLLMLDNSEYPEVLKNHPKQLVVALYEGAFNHQVDDVIVRLYWLIFRNQFPELVYE